VVTAGRCSHVQSVLRSCAGRIRGFQF
jgi:hypothetical protein